MLICRERFARRNKLLVKKDIKLKHHHCVVHELLRDDIKLLTRLVLGVARAVNAGTVATFACHEPLLVHGFPCKSY